MRPFSFNNPHPLTFQNKELRKLPAKSPQPLDPLLLDNMVTKDGWLKAAMTEDAMVAELLVRIKQVHALAPIKTEIASAVDLPPPRWGVRFPRSRLAFTCSPTKGVGYRRNSPKTPLSWTTGTTSSSGTADGFDDTDLPGCGSSRSKRTVSGDECVSPSATIKSRSRRRKKSFEEETTERRTTQLLEEEEVVIVNNSCFTDEQRSGRNESLMIKRMKLDLGSACSADNKYKNTFNDALPNHHVMFPLQHPSPTEGFPQVRNHQQQQQRGNAHVLLPDLNLMPIVED